MAAIVSELFRFGRYKRNQGQIARRDYANARQTLEQAMLVADKLHLRVLSAQGHALLGNALRLSDSAIGNPTQPAAANPRTMEF